MSLEAASAQLRRRGALEVHACGVAVEGADTLSSLDSYAYVHLLPEDLPEVPFRGQVAEPAEVVVVAAAETATG